MPPKAPTGLRWCKTCNEYRPVLEFGNALSAYCHPHWLIYNRAKSAKIRKNHPGKDAERVKRWQEANPERVQARNKAWAAEQKALGYPGLKSWLAANPEKARKLWRDSGRKWREANPEKAAAARHRKRARKARAPGQHTGVELMALREQFSGCCIYCGASADTWDHVLSLFQGGTNFIWNIVPACRSCNSKKQHTPPEMFLKGREIAVEALQYITSALQQGEALLESHKYRRNPYEKVAEQTLWDAAKQVFQQNGKVTEIGLASTSFHPTTFRRRLGGMGHINAVLGAKT